MAIALKPVTITAATTLSRNRHAGAVVSLNSTTGRAITLPATAGTGDVYTLFIGTTVSSGNHTVVPTGSDVINGGVGISTALSSGRACLASAAIVLVTMNGSTQGGLQGSWLRFTDIVAGKWMVEGFLVSSGSETTPFS